MSITSKEIWFVQINMLPNRTAIARANLQEAFGSKDVKEAAVGDESTDYQLSRARHQLRWEVYRETSHKGLVWDAIVQPLVTGRRA